MSKKRVSYKVVADHDLQQDIDFRGVWINQNGSFLRITGQQNQVLTGTFISKKGRAARGTEYPVLGTVNGELISFSVNFRSGDQNLAAITNFSGRYARTARGVEQIHTQWILARQYEDEARQKRTQVWNTFLTNADVFEKTED